MIAVDLGSNTLRVLQVDCETLEYVASFERVVRTADGLEHSGKVNAKSLQKIIESINEAREEIDFSSDTVRAVTTEALRRASNAAEVIRTVYVETGIEFEVISGEEEASLTLLAVRHRLQLLHSGGEGQKKNESFLLADIGGGSTELIFNYPDRVLTRSFPVGIVTTVHRYNSIESIKSGIPGDMAKMQRYVQEIYHKEGRVESFVATAGTPTTVAALKLGQKYASYNPEQINGTVLTVDDLDSALKRLLSMTFEEREIYVGVGRGDLITAGILIFRELFLIAGMRECIVIDDGLREGVALQECRGNSEIIEGV